jgi:multidrug transporter EmrE-like cation transporter
MTGRILGLPFVLASALLEAYGQTAFKQAAEWNAPGMRPFALLRGLWRNQRILAGIACFILEAILWTLALSHLPISIAFPTGSMVFVFVALVSRMFLHQQIAIHRWIGITLILGGVILVGS